VLRPLLAVIRTRHRLNRLDVVAHAGHWRVEGQVNPSLGSDTNALIDGADPARSDGSQARPYEIS